jgi:hypothetical protein
MTTEIILKKSSVEGKIPLAGDLSIGELAINLFDKKLYSKDGNGVIIELTGGSGSIIDSVDPAENTNPGFVGATWANSTTGGFFVCIDSTADANVWYGVHSNKQEIPALPTDFDYLVVAGGGGGASRDIGAGGGAGGLLSGSDVFEYGAIYTIVIGAGGGTRSYDGMRGENSSFYGGLFDLESIGGGGGMGYSSDNNQNNGGSGGGGHGYSDESFALGTAGQGNDGGMGERSGSWYGGGGGGGAGAVGGHASATGLRNGGVGIASDITGSSVYYAGGGGGSGHRSSGNNLMGAGGLGGGGNATASLNTAEDRNGADNTGGGGGAGRSSSGSYYEGGNGGSGIVIIRSKAPATTTGSPITTTDGLYNVYAFTGSGTITF